MSDLNPSLLITPHGSLRFARNPENRERRIAAAFEEGTPSGLLHLATAELSAALPADLAFAREFAHRYLTALCQTPNLEGAVAIDPIAPPSDEELAKFAMRAPPVVGSEYLEAAAMADWWRELDAFARGQIAAFDGGALAWLHKKNPIWRLVGRVTFHLAENKRDAEHPFAFLATYANRLSERGRVEHWPLSRALNEYAGSQNRAALLSLLTPIHEASKKIEWVARLLDDGSLYAPLAWTPREAYALLQSVESLESSGLIVRVPNWWSAKNPPRVRVNVKIGEAAASKLGADAILDFDIGVALDGQAIDKAELQELFDSTEGLVRLRGQWVQVDAEKLRQALSHWKSVARGAKEGLSFYEGMRLLAGAKLEAPADAQADRELRQWTGLVPGEWLSRTLAQLRDPQATDAAPPSLRADLRPYQRSGVHWLRFMTRLGLGACLADDMGLGKTLQVLALLLHLRQESREPSLLVVPASLIANWMSEIGRFAPSIGVFVAHPSETDADLQKPGALKAHLMGVDLVITTYGMLARIQPLREQRWRLVVLDEAQAIKNSGSRQTRIVKELQAAARIALTGTPIENRLSDLWSLFDFLNPGLLGSARTFSGFVKRLQSQEEPDFAPLRSLVGPYILRRLKTDKRVIADLPEKAEINAYCALSPQQAALYQRSVEELAQAIKETQGIQRRGLVLAFLIRFKQICNHPSHWTGQGGWKPEHSGKFERLGELCEELAQRQEKALIFTQFREMTLPLSEYLGRIFKADGLVLDGSTPIKRRREMVESFGREEGPPFFVLSLKAGGTGLNLTAASHVIHFDRWWNPAVENQATDRAFRIGQKRNVMVHKFVCRGTVEERIDAMINEKSSLSRQLIDGGAEATLTEMDDSQLLRFVALDVDKAMNQA